MTCVTTRLYPGIVNLTTTHLDQDMADFPTARIDQGIVNLITTHLDQDMVNLPTARFTDGGFSKHSHFVPPSTASFSNGTVQYNKLSAYSANVSPVS